MFVNVKINESGADFPFPVHVQGIEAYPPNIFPLLFLYKQIVGPILSHLL